jgi:hypothetical protein
VPLPAAAQKLQLLTAAGHDRGLYYWTRPAAGERGTHAAAVGMTIRHWMRDARSATAGDRGARPGDEADDGQRVNLWHAGQSQRRLL